MEYTEIIPQIYLESENSLNNIYSKEIPIDLSQYTKIISFEPRISGVTSKMVIQINTSNILIKLKL